MNNKYQLQHKLKSAQDFIAQGKTLHAIQVYNHLIDESPDFFEAYFDLAELYYSTGNFQAAINLLLPLVEKNPDNKDVRLFTGQFLLRNSKWDEAIEILSYMLPEEEHMVSFFLGYSHFMLKEFELSKINFKNYIELEKNTELFYEANLYLAKIEIELNNFDSALKYAKIIEKIYSNFWELNLIYAICYYNLDMTEHALTSITKSIKLNPKAAINYELAGKIYFALGDYLKAEKNFLKCVELNHDVTSEIYSKLAEACLKASKTKDALNYFDIALKLDPGNKFADEGKKKASIILKKAAD